MQSQYTINGKVYRLVEEEKKPERLSERKTFWIKKHDSAYDFWETEISDISLCLEEPDFKNAICVKEIKKGEVIVSRDDVIKAWENIFKGSKMIENAHLKICKELGL
jgi:hypothetical protein